MPERILRVIAADDEPIARRGIERLLRSSPDLEIVAICANGIEALEAIRRERPDVAFLDIAMPGMTGIDVARALTAGERPAIVFVTAFDRFAVEAFEIHAVDYLLKPFDDERFAETLSRARTRVGAVDQPVIDALLDALARKSSAPQRIAVKDGDRTIFVDPDELDWCEAADNYIRLHSGGRKHLVRETMRAMEQRLDPARFARIHRSAIVNLRRVAEIRPLFHGDQQVLLRDGTKLTLSRGYRDAFLDLMRGR